MPQKRWTIEDLKNKGFNEFGEKVPAGKPVKRSKYGNRKVKETGHDSQSESDFARRLKMVGINFEEKVRIEVFPGCEYRGEKIQPIYIIPDFLIKSNGQLVAIVDTKHITGYTKKKTPIKGTEDWRIKVKMLKAYFKAKGNEIPMFFPVSKKEKEETLVALLTIIDNVKG